MSDSDNQGVDGEQPLDSSSLDESGSEHLSGLLGPAYKLAPLSMKAIEASSALAGVQALCEKIAIKAVAPSISFPFIEPRGGDRSVKGVEPLPQYGPSREIQTRDVLMYERLEPKTSWSVSRLSDVDKYTLEEAAELATLHSQKQVKPMDFVRAAGRGEIRLLALCPRETKFIYLDKADTVQNAPVDSLLNLPISACKQMEVTGEASWRTMDGFERDEDFVFRYDRFRLSSIEPDLVSRLSDCRVRGRDVHALADAYCDKEPVSEKSRTDVEKTEATTNWQTEARNIAETLLNKNPSLKRLNQEQIAAKVHQEMVSQNITGRGGRVPDAQTIKRRALRGIKKG